jgi:DNA polymerase-3 subunit beta
MYMTISNFVIDARILGQALSIVTRAVPSKTTLPILFNILLRGTGNQLEVSATNLDIDITAWLDATIEGKVDITLPAKILSEVVSSVSGLVTFSVDDKKVETNITCGKFRSTVRGMRGSEFPASRPQDMTKMVEVEAGTLRDAIDKVIIAASTEEARPTLTCVNFVADSERLTLACTDTFIVTENILDLEVDLGKYKALVPSSVMRELGRIVSATKGAPIGIVYTDSSMAFFVGNYRLVSRTMDGEFPQYIALIPRAFATRVEVLAVDFLVACNQAKIFASEGMANVIRVDIADSGRIVIRAESAASGSSEAVVDAQTISGPGLLIGLNVDYVLRALSVFKSPTLIMEFNTSKTPFYIHGDNDQGFRFIGMPMNLDGK